jgi:hypothetical protein
LAQEITTIPQAEHELMLRIADGRPLQASELGELLSALARDYRQMNRGRSLAVVRIETGSLLIFLQDAVLAAKPLLSDAVEIAKGGKALLDFAKGIEDLIGKKKTPSTDLAEGRKEGPYRSIEAMVKTAADAGSELTIKHVANDGESLEVHLTPKDAVEIRARTRQAEIHAKIYRDERSLEGVPRTMITADRARELADEIEQLALPGSSDPHPLISTVVRLSTDVRMGTPGDMRKGSLVQFSVIAAYNPWWSISPVGWVRSSPKPP